MDFEFDKEIDSLLRRTAKGESVQTFDAHLDADEISLFAENALTTKARASAVGHLAECAKCRKILSNVISFNAEAESEIIHAEESDIVAVAPPIPWYRRLFTFPQITYAMGALALVFSGIIAVMVLQTANNDSQNTSVAMSEKVSETSKGTGGASSDGELQTVENYSTNASNSASVNPGVMNNSNMTMANTSPNAPRLSANSNANIALPAPREPQPETNQPVKTERENDFVADAQTTSNTATLNKPSVSGATIPKDEVRQRANELGKDKAETKRDEDGKTLSDSQLGRRSTREAPKSVAKKTASEDKNKAGEERAVGGKTFRNLGGIWFDSAYTSQSPIMIRRGSDDYKRLDSGLRSIAESLGGTVIVVWKSRAYRIH